MVITSPFWQSLGRLWKTWTNKDCFSSQKLQSSTNSFSELIVKKAKLPTCELIDFNAVLVCCMFLFSQRSEQSVYTTTALNHHSRVGKRHSGSLSLDVFSLRKIDRSYSWYNSLSSYTIWPLVCSWTFSQSDVFPQAVSSSEHHYQRLHLCWAIVRHLHWLLIHLRHPTDFTAQGAPSTNVRAIYTKY